MSNYFDLLLLVISILLIVVLYFHEQINDDDDVFIHFDRMHERDRRTDTHTDVHRMTAWPRLHSIAGQ